MQWQIQSFAELGSTQEALKMLASEGFPEGTAVQALQQKAGKGRHGRQWESPAGNLYLSFLLRPHGNVQAVGQISLLCAVALAKAIEETLGGKAEIRVKWPNDVFLEGRKCGGILLDSSADAAGRLEWIIAGIGVNVSAGPAGIGTFLNDHSEKPVVLSDFRDKLLAHIAVFYDIWRNDGFDLIREEWLALTFEKGVEVSVKLGADVQKGAFAGIDENGNLLLHGDEGNMRVISAGDVYFSES